jgi:D-alanine--poly(phosphoribitol) ligase subunit 2
MITALPHQDTDVESRVHQIFRDGLELQVDLGTDVIASGMLDSLAFVRLLVALEEEFGLEVDLAAMDLEDFSSVSSVARLVTASSRSAT